jgi:hypothetical protein
MIIAGGDILAGYEGQARVYQRGGHGFPCQCVNLKGRAKKVVRFYNRRGGAMDKRG